MPKNKKMNDLSALEKLLIDAKDSKHTDAILLLSEKKSDIQIKVIELLKNTMPEETAENKTAIEGIKKSIATFAEYVFNESVAILVADKQ